MLPLYISLFFYQIGLYIYRILKKVGLNEEGEDLKLEEDKGD
jgi:cbb3-type cytochrome oxidase subunit 3